MSLTICCPPTGAGLEADGGALEGTSPVPAQRTLGPVRAPRRRAADGARYDSDAFGRFAEGLARFLGTGRFLVAQTVLVFGWIVLNVVGLVHHWDPYPFILLNLAFSTQAAYAAPLILLAQNRQDDRDRANIERDREVASRTQADTEFLARELAAVRLALSDVVTNEDLNDSLEQPDQADHRRERGLRPGRFRQRHRAGPPWTGRTAAGNDACSTPRWGTRDPW